MNFTSNKLKNNNLLDFGQLFTEVKYGINTYASGRGYSCIYFYCLLSISFRLHPPRGITQKFSRDYKNLWSTITYLFRIYFYQLNTEGFV